jgi:sugar phosphate isomerase/epimerase
MKLGLHAYSLLLAGGLREYQPLGRGVLPADQLLEKAAQWKFSALQLARQNITAWDMVSLVHLRDQAEKLGLTLHLSTNSLVGEHLSDMIRHAHTLGAEQVSVGLARLQGNVQQRKQTLEALLSQLDVAIKTAEKYKIMLAIENGRHTAAADLVALIQAAQSAWIGICFDMGNPLTVPEDPREAAELLAPYCKSVHLKDFQVYRTADGAMLVNCPLGEGVINIPEVLGVLNQHQLDLPVFLQTVAERWSVPVLDDAFLQRYPRITARALARLLRLCAADYNADAMCFPHERERTSEPAILKWEEDRLKRSREKYFGAQSLTLPLEG